MTIEHGKTLITVIGDIITIKAIGAFNKEGILKTIAQLKSEIENFDGNEFKLLFNYLETEGGTPDVFEKINECNVWLNTQKMVAKALVIQSSAHLAILESRTPARRSQNAQNFDNIEAAMNWLKRQ